MTRQNIFIKIDSIINGEKSECDEDELSVEDRSYFKYVPVVSRNVKKSFPRDYCRAFKFENLKSISINNRLLCWYSSRNNLL